MRNAAVKGEAAMAYGAFADIYDAFNEDADYAALTSYVLHQMKAHGIHEGIVADLGCGTRRFDTGTGTGRVRHDRYRSL